MPTSRLTLWLIIFLTIVSVFFSLPPASDLPDSLGFFKQQKFEFQFGGRRIDLSFLAPENLIGIFPLKLGLDLQGGTQLVLQTQMEGIPESDRDSALESAREVIERRVNLYGVSEST